jgi:hypothetical protein
MTRVLFHLKKRSLLNCCEFARDEFTGKFYYKFTSRSFFFSKNAPQSLKDRIKAARPLPKSGDRKRLSGFHFLQLAAFFENEDVPASLPFF